MYITINDIIGEKRIDLSYPIDFNKEVPEGPSWRSPTQRSVEVAVVIMLSNNVQYWLQGSIEVLLKTSEKIVLNKGEYTDREINSLIGLGLKLQMISSHNDVLRTNKLDNITKMVFSWEELNNSNNLEDGQPSNTLFKYYVTGPAYSTCFEPAMPQYKKLKNGEINSLALKITENNKIITDGPGTTVVLHICDCKI